MTSASWKHSYTARRAVLITVALLAAASIAYELTVGSGDGPEAILNAAIDGFLVVFSLWELRHGARTEYLALTLGVIYGGLSIFDSMYGSSFTNFEPAMTLAMLILIGVIYLATRDRLSAWPVLLYSGAIAVYAVVTMITHEMSSDDAMALVLIGGPGQAIVMWMIHRMIRGLYKISEAEARQARIQRALAQCSEALLSKGATDPLKTALTALLDATDASYAYIDVHRDQDGNSTWEIVAEAIGDEYPKKDSRLLQGGYQWMGETEGLLRSGKPSRIVTKDLPMPLRAEYEAEGIRAEIMAPIFIQDRWMGTIGYTDHAREGTWTDYEIEGLMRAADMVGAYWQRDAAREGLFELAHAKDRFIAAVSHELRTPLAAVVGFAGELAQRADQYSQAEISEMADFVYSQSMELTQLVDDLLTSERAASGNLTITSGDVMLKAASIRAAASIFGQPEVKVSGSEVAARADGLRTRQILRNLITNAMRYGGDDITVSVTEKGGFALVVVSDDGPGVTGIDGEKIFDPYYRAKGDESTPDSVGLGLSVARQLARLMDGDLVYRRVSGRTEFELRLPLGSQLGNGVAPGESELLTAARHG